MTDWTNILDSIINDDVEKLSSFIPSRISFDSIIPNDTYNENHSLLTFASKVNGTKCAIFLAKGGSDVNYSAASSLTSYLYSVMNNNIELVNFFLNFEGTNINAFDSNGFYALHIAASKGHEELLSIFLTKKIYDPNLLTHSSQTSETALIISIKYNKLNAFKTLLENGADPNLPNSESVFPLHVAVKDVNDPTFLKNLLKCQIDANCRDRLGYTPLLLSSKQGKSEFFEILFLSGKTDINSVTNDGENIFFFSVSKPIQLDKHVFLMAIQNPSFNLNFQNSDGDTILHSLVSNSNLVEIKLLINFIDRFDPNIVNNANQTALDVSIANKKMEIISILLDCDKVFLTEFSKKSHLFHLAAANNTDTLIKPLIKRGLNPDEDEGMGTTPLMMAVMKNHFTFAKKLISTRKVDVNKPNRAGQNPLLIASMIENGEMLVRLLLCHPLLRPNCQNNLGETPLINAIRYGNAGTVEVLLENSAVDPNFVGKQREVPFLEAVKSGNIRMILAFCNNCNTDLCISDDEKSNAVHYAILSGDFEVLELVLEIDGIDVKQKSDAYDSPLEMILKNQNLELAPLIVDKVELALSQIPEDELSSDDLEQRNICTAVSQLIEVFKSMNSPNMFL